MELSLDVNHVGRRQVCGAVLTLFERKLIHAMLAQVGLIQSANAFP
jgi:hypothetical protein